MLFGDLAEKKRSYRIEKFETVVPFYNGELKTVQTTVLIPTNQPQKKKSIVMIYPGYNFSLLSQPLDGSSISIPTAIFLDEGFAIVLPDLTISPEERGGNPIQEMTDILIPQVYHAAFLGHIDLKHVGLIGHSYGGYGTAAIITRTHLFRCAVAIAGVFDLAGNYGEYDQEYPLHNINWWEGGQGRMKTSPWDNLSHYIENSPYYLADKIHTPLLLIHGEDDANCNVMESKKMYSALLRLNREAYLKTYPKQGHSITDWNIAEAQEASKEIIRFLHEKL